MKRVRDFHSQTWRNPFFGRDVQPARLRTRIWRAAQMAGLTAASGIIVYGAAYSPLLRLDKVEVAGADTVDPVRVKAVVSQTLAGYDYLAIPRNHMLFAHPSGIKNMVLLNFPAIRSVEVKRGFDKVTVMLEEKKPTYRMIVGEKSYLLDQDGAGLREAAPGEGDKLIALSQVSLNFAPNVNVMPAELLTAVSDLHKYFATQIGVRDRLFRIDRQNGDIEAETTEGWYAVFDPSIDVKTQLDTLSSALFGKFSPEERKRLSYIDVRFGDRVFYKWK
jgi:hypothetical protein